MIWYKYSKHFADKFISPVAVFMLRPGGASQTPPLSPVIDGVGLLQLECITSSLITK